MGVSVHPFESYRHAVDCIAERIAAGVKTFCLAINPEKVYRAGRSEEAAGLLGRADIRICDGVGVALAARVLCRRRIVRCTGIQLFFDLVAEASVRKWNIFLLGASQESNELACRNLLERYPGLRIVGRLNGYFEDSAAVVNEINLARPEILFVAMGSPRQEAWIIEHRDALAVPFCMGVGGAFDVVSGKAMWAPGLFRRTGTEFLYRLLKEPKRWRRQLALPLFAAEVFKEKLSLRG